VTGKVLVGHAGLRSPIATWPPRLTFVGMSGLLLNLTRTSDGADWALAATSASRLGSSLRAKVVCWTSNGHSRGSSQPPGFSREPTRVAAYGTKRPPHIEDWTPLVPATVTRAYISRLVCQESIEVPCRVGIDSIRPTRAQIVKIYRNIQYTIYTSGQPARWSCKYIL